MESAAEDVVSETTSTDSGVLSAPILNRATSRGASAPFVPAAGDGQPRRESDADSGAERPRPNRVSAFGAASATCKFGAIVIERRVVGPEDVLLEILFASICHSDIHTARSEWGPARYPCVPGHEIIGRVRAISEHVRKFRVGDIGGVGSMVNACRTCEQWLADREQNCQHGSTFTHDSHGTDASDADAYTFGGYSDAIVIAQHFVIRIPPGADLAATAPLLCAGITTFSPMEHWKLQPGQRVGIVGLGGLGHMAVKLATARRSHVTVFTTSAGKLTDAERLGARDEILSSDATAMDRVAGTFDLIISTVPQAYPMWPFMELLALDGTLVNVGALAPLEGINGTALAAGRKSLAGSMIGGLAETQQLADDCAARRITADSELISPHDIDSAYGRIVRGDVRFRFVIDMSVGRCA
jgi:uncharacterized zinc-type alcohol dehydrogenase-like protein